MNAEDKNCLEGGAVRYYLAIDIGASSGRHILAHLEDGNMVLEEVHRFPNGMTEKDGELVWDVDELSAQIVLGSVGQRRKTPGQCGGLQGRPDQGNG